MAFWGIVNNAGVVILGSLVADSERDVRTTFGSISGTIAGSEDGGYSASKFAIEGYTDSPAAELADAGVHVSVVDPGGYKSEIRSKMLAQVLAAADAGEIELDAASREK